MAGWQMQNWCCCDLELGCYVVAALDLLLSVASIVYGSYDMATVSEIERHSIDLCVNVPMIIAAVLSLLASALLIYGVFMKRPSQLLAWLILKPLSIVCLIGGLIAFFVIEAGTLSEEGDPRMAERVRAVLTPWLVATAILTLIRIYFWVVVHSYYKVVKSWGNSHGIKDRVRAMMFKMAESKG